MKRKLILSLVVLAALTLAMADTAFADYSATGSI